MKAFCEGLLKRTYETYEKALRTSRDGKDNLILKRRIRDRKINNYNPEMLYAWDANMDIQLALDPYAVITYIVEYMNKDETQMTKFMTEALKTQGAQKNAANLYMPSSY